MRAAKRKDASAAREYWVRARDGITPVVGMGNDPNVLVVRASALLLLNDLSAARPVIQRLAGMGFRTRDFTSLLAAKKISYPVNMEIARRFIGEGSLQAQQESH